MRYTIQCTYGDEEVEATEFTIPGSNEKFIVHRAMIRKGFAATHAETGFAIGFGTTPERAIANGTRAWNAVPESRRAQALNNARTIIAARASVPYKED